MVINYLEKIREKFQNELMELNKSLNKVISKKKENTEIIKLLELNNDAIFESFTPRPVNNFNKTKIAELSEEQKKIEYEIIELRNRITNVEKELSEVTEVIKVAKGCIF